MSRSSRRRLAWRPYRGRRREDGFTLIEVMVSLGLLAVASAAVLPLLISGVRAAYVSKLHTQAKNLAQEQVDRMRNLPYYVSVSVTPAGNPYLDLLDIYFRDLSTTGNSQCPTSGRYVSVSSQRLSGEPAVPFYRCTGAPIQLDGTAITVTTATQFIDYNKNAITPPAGYNSQTTAGENPPSLLVGTTVIVRWTRGGVTRQYVSFTEIASTLPATPQLVLQARAEPLRITGLTGIFGAPQSQVFLGPSIALDGSQYLASTVTAVAQGGEAEFAPGTETTTCTTADYCLHVLGARSVATAPSGAGGPLAATVTPWSIYRGGCGYRDQGVFSEFGGYDGYLGGLTCLGQTNTANVAAAVTNGLPTAGSVGTPVTATMSSGGSLPSGKTLAPGFGFGNVCYDPFPAESDRPINDECGERSSPRKLDSVNKPLITMSGGTGALLTATGYLNTTSGNTHTAVASASASTAAGQWIDIFPASFAGASSSNCNASPGAVNPCNVGPPRNPATNGTSGVVQVRLDNASITCTSTVNGTLGASTTPAASWTATVRYWHLLQPGEPDYIAGPYTGARAPRYGYGTPITITNNGAANPLAAINLATTEVYRDATSVHFLSEYISSWSGLTAPVANVEGAQRATVSDVSGIVNITTVSASDSIADRGISIVIGALSCATQDNR